jgi:SH3-like domain-containing protein
MQRRARWVPEQLLQSEGQEAILLRDYTARELEVRIGTDMTVNEALSGWVWVTDADGREGWIPQSCVAPA